MICHHRVPSSSVVEHPTRSQRVVGSNLIWDLDFFRVYVSPRIYVISGYHIEQVNCKERTTCTNSSEVKPDLCEDQDQQNAAIFSPQIGGKTIFGSTFQIWLVARFSA